MSFKCTFTSQNYSITWPNWFIEKYQDRIYFYPDKKGPISSINTIKIHKKWTKNLIKDIQQCILFKHNDDVFHVVFVHESGKVLLCTISQDTISWKDCVDFQEVSINQYKNFYYEPHYVEVNRPQLLPNHQTTQPEIQIEENYRSKYISNYQPNNNYKDLSEDYSSHWSIR